MLSVPLPSWAGIASRDGRNGGGADPGVGALVRIVGSETRADACWIPDADASLRGAVPTIGAGN